MPINPFAVNSGLPPQPKPLFFQKVPKSDALANALIQGAYSSQPKSPFEAVGKLAQLWSGTRQKDKYLAGEEAKAKAPFDALRAALAAGKDPVAAMMASEDPEMFMTGLKQKMAAPEYDFTNVDGTLVRTDAAGNATPVFGGGTDGAPPPLFKGTSVEAQALNGLVANGDLTREQAMQLGAGKTITGPQGQIIFMTPQGVFSKPADGSAEATPEGTEVVDQNPGLIPLTGNKTEGTEGQMSAGLYADRMRIAHELINNLEGAGTSLQDSTLSQVPVVGNYLVGEEYQKFDQAKRDFVNAVLRRESGAVISEEEFDNANKQYFPQPGNGPEVLAQKRRNRETAIAGIQRAAGPNYKPPQGAPTDETVIDGYTIRQVP